MKSKSLLILAIAVLFVLSCTVSQKSAVKRSDPQTVREGTLVSGIKYSLEDLESMDMEDMDRAFFTNEPVISKQIKQTPNSKILRYSLQDLEGMDMEDMDRAFFTNEPVISKQIKQIAHSKSLPYSLQDLEDMDMEDMDRAFFTNEPNLCPKKWAAN